MFAEEGCRIFDDDDDDKQRVALENVAVGGIGLHHDLER